MKKTKGKCITCKYYTCEDTSNWGTPYCILVKDKVEPSKGCNKWEFYILKNRT